MKFNRGLLAILTVLLAFAAMLLPVNAQVGAKNRLEPNVSLQGKQNEVPAGAVLTFNGGTLQSGKIDVGLPFVATASLTSAAAATPVTLLSATAVPLGKKVYITGFHAKVTGSTAWATTATVKIQDTNGTPVDYFTIAVAALTGNAEIRPGTANVTNENAYILGTGGTATKGLQLKGNVNGTGSTLTVTVQGIIK